MKTILIILCTLLLTSPLMAQATPVDTSKQAVLYFDTDSTLLSKQTFVDKVNKGKYTLAITTRGNKTYMYITPAQKGRQKAEAVRTKPRQ